MRLHRRFMFEAPAWTPASLPGLEAWYRADLGVTTSGGAVSAWADQSGNGRTLSQASGSSQPTLNASDANWGGKPSITFDGTNDSLVAASAAPWRFLHDGTGGAALLAMRRTNNVTAVLLGTFAISSEVGANFSFATNGRVNFAVTNGSGTTLAAVSANNAAVPGANMIVRYEVKSGRAGGDVAALVNGTSVATTSFGAFAPSSANPTRALEVGRQPVAGTYTGFDVFEIVLLSTLPSTSELAAYRDYINALTSNAFAGA